MLVLVLLVIGFSDNGERYFRLGVRWCGRGEGRGRSVVGLTWQELVGGKGEAMQ